MMEQVLLAPNQMPGFDEHRYPLFASLKLDGRRCLVQGGQLFSRTMKGQPNLHLPDHLKQLLKLSKAERLSFDGELYSHDIPFGELESTFKSLDAPVHPSIRFHCFDALPTASWGDCGLPFSARKQIVYDYLTGCENVVVVKQAEIGNAHQCRFAYESAIEAGYEGLILRTAGGRYKHGRATLKEGIIFKMKAFETADAVVIGFEEQVRLKAGVVRGVNELGRTAKTYRAEDHEPAGTMGALRVRDEAGREFNMGWGRGWTHLKRANLWARRAKLVGQWVEFRYMVAGEKDLPRMPQLLRFREAKT